MTLACTCCRRFSTQRLILFSALLIVRFARSISLACDVAHDHNRPPRKRAFLTGRRLLKWANFRAVMTNSIAVRRWETEILE